MMIGEVFFLQGDEPTAEPAYRLDLLGNLVRCGKSGPAGGLVPFGNELVTSAAELVNPYPWTLTIEQVAERLVLVADARQEVRLAYPGLVIARSAYPFVPHVVVDEEPSLIEQAIEVFPSLGGDDAVAMVEQLTAIGIFPIPITDVFSDAIHEAAGEGICVPPIKYVAAGWMSSMKVFRKALVRSA